MHLPALTNYLQGLRENNAKGWFVMNKPAYDILRAEFIALVGEVIVKLSKADPRIADVNAKKSLFRIYRDIRFSNDKTPYKTHFSAALAEGNAKHFGPMYYLSIDADARLHLGAGCYLPPKDVLERLRRHALADPQGLAKVMRGKKIVEAFGALKDDDQMVRLPKGYDPADPAVARAAEWLRHRSFVVSTDIDLAKRSETKAANDLAGTIVSRLSAAVPLNDWLRKAPPA